MKKKKEPLMNYVKCECSYNNNPERLKAFGTCLRCGKVLDEKAKYRYEMNKRLKLWREKKW